MAKKTIEKDQIIKVQGAYGTYLAIVTKVKNAEYVSCIKSDGTVIADVYIGFIDPLDGTKLRVSDCLTALKELENKMGL